MEETLTTEVIPYNCPNCPMIFAKPESLKMHVKTIHNENIVVCKNCPLFFENQGKLSLHSRQFHNKGRDLMTKNKTHQCNVPGCTYQTDNGGVFRHHMRAHLDVKPFICAICHKGFTQKSNMKTHFNRHKKNNFQFKCEPCEKEFNTYDTYLSHLATREHGLATFKVSLIVDFHCMICNADFNNPNDIYQHVFNYTELKENVISCNICHMSLTHDLNVLEDHYKFHSETLVCPFCNDETVFTDKTKFNYHLSKKHNEKVVRRSVCRYCEISFKNEADKDQHVKTEHKDEINKHISKDHMGRIHCPINGCQVSTNSELFLQKHLKSHYGKFDVDIFYKDNINNKELNTEKNPTRKRGRPRLCESSFKSDCVSDSVNDVKDIEIKRKRGRPKKNVDYEFENTINDQINKTVQDDYVFINNASHFDEHEIQHFFV